MRQLVQQKPGQPGVEWVEVAAPQPQPGQALVRVEAVGLNRADVLYMQQSDQRWRIGLDAVGTVETSDPEADGPPPGTRVLLHLPEGGGAAELIAMPVHRLVRWPQHLNPAVGAALPLAGLVALRLVRRAGALTGRRVLLTGASGGVGLPLAQVALANGAQVVAAVRAGESADHLRAAGVQVVSAEQRIEGPFDVVFESVGGQIGSRAVAAIGPRGQVIWFGQASGQPLELDFFTGLVGGQGFTVTHFVYSENDPHTEHDLAQLVDLAAQGLVVPHVGTIEGRDSASAALDRLREGRQPGKAVITL